MNPSPHHDGSPLYVSDHSPDLGDAVDIRLRVPVGSTAVRAVYSRSNPDMEARWDPAELLGESAGWQWWQSRLTIVNPREHYRWFIVYEDGASVWVNQEGVSTTEPLDAQDFAISTEAEPPQWMYGAVMYQIFPDRFAASPAAAGRELPDWAEPADWSDPVNPVMPHRMQQYYGGDLDGITGKLEYLRDLGVSIVYLTPIYPGASNHRYDASTFDSVDPLLGGDEAYIRFVDRAHELGMKVMGDLTTNHSGDRHEWFRSALESADAPEADYFYFSEAGGERDYESWLGVESLPKFNWASQALRDRFIEGPESVVGKWLATPFNADGWRIDVANMTGRYGNVDLNAEVRRILRRTMEDVNPNTLLIAESTNDSTADTQGDAWHGAMTYTAFTRPLWAWLSRNQGVTYQQADGSTTDQPWYFGLPATGFPHQSALDFARSVDRFNAVIPWRVRLGNLLTLDTHDTARFATHVAEETVPLAVGLCMTLPGLPMVFAGDELGLVGSDGELSRQPMPWDTIGEPEVAQRLELYRELIDLRRTHPALAEGGFRWLHRDENTLVFIRESADESVLVAVSTAEFAVTLPAMTLPEGITPVEDDAAAGARRLFGTGEFEVSAIESAELRGPGPSFTVWEVPGLAIPPAT